MLSRCAGLVFFSPPLPTVPRLLVPLLLLVRVLGVLQWVGVEVGVVGGALMTVLMPL